MSRPVLIRPAPPLRCPYLHTGVNRHFKMNWAVTHSCCHTKSPKASSKRVYVAVEMHFVSLPLSHPSRVSGPFSFLVCALD